MKFAVMGFVMSILGATKGAAGAGEVLAPNWVRLAFRTLDSLETDELRLNDFSHSMSLSLPHPTAQSLPSSCRSEQR